MYSADQVLIVVFGHIAATGSGGATACFGEGAAQVTVREECEAFTVCFRCVS